MQTVESDSRERPPVGVHNTLGAAFIFGCQRSGTTALGHALGAHPNVEHFPEDDPRAFDDYFLRDAHVIKDWVRQFPDKRCVFKPISQSHQALDVLDTYDGALGIWIFRDPHEVVNSMAYNIPKSISYVPEEIDRAYTALPAEDFEEIFSDITTTKYRIVTNYANLFYLCWLVKNLLFFHFALDKRSDVKLVHYTDMLGSDQHRQDLLRFLSLPDAECFNSLRKTQTPFRKYAASWLLVEPSERLYDRLRSVMAEQEG